MAENKIAIVTKRQQAKYIDDLATATATAKAKWLDSQMHRLLPQEIYMCAYSNSGRQRTKVSKYMVQNNIKIEERPPQDPTMKGAYSCTNLIVGDVLVSEFRVRLNGVTVEVMSKDYPLQNLSDHEVELAQYIGLPKCQDCGWKLGTAITDNCSCHSNVTPERTKLHEAAFNRARELQSIVLAKPKA